MKIIYYLLIFLNLKKVNSERIIRNINTPSCKNCIHYEPNIYDYDINSSLNKCNNFGSKDIITNKIDYDYANECRKDEMKCGIEAKYFEKEKNIELKMTKFKILKNFPIILFYTYISIYILVLIININKI